MSGTLTLTVCVVIESMGGGIIHVAPLAERGWMRVGEEDVALVELGAFLTQQLTSADHADVTRLVAFFCEADTAIRQGEVAVVMAEGGAPVSVEYACIELEDNAGPFARVAHRERKNSVALERPNGSRGRSSVLHSVAGSCVSVANRKSMARCIRSSLMPFGRDTLLRRVGALLTSSERVPLL